MTDEKPAEKKRSRRIYVWWGMPFVLLLALGLVCWKVVLPVWQTRAAVIRIQQIPLRRETLPPRPRWPGRRVDVRAELEGMGGPTHAVRRLSLYLRIPKRLAPHRDIAVETLGACGDEAVPVLLRMLEDDEKGPRAQAAVELGKIGNPRAIGPLLSRLKDKDEQVRWVTAEALGRFGPEARRAVPELVKLLQDSALWVRWHAAEALGRIGPDAREALPALKRLADRRMHSSDKTAALEAIPKIRGDKKPAQALYWEKQFKKFLYSTSRRFLDRTREEKIIYYVPPRNYPLTVARVGIKTRAWAKLLELGPAAAPSLRRILVSAASADRPQLLGLLGGADQKWTLAILTEYVESDVHNEAIEALCSAERLAGTQFFPQGTRILSAYSRDGVMAKLTKEEFDGARAKFRIWWQKEGRAKYGRGE